MTHKDKLVNSPVSLSLKATAMPDDELKTILKSYQEFL